MPPGRTSLQMTLASQGRSVSALAGAVSGSGTVTLQSAGIAGLDPRAFEVAIRASDAGQAINDTKLRQIVEPALAAGNLRSPRRRFPSRSGTAGCASVRPRSTARPRAPSSRAAYDVAADQVDIRASLTSTTIGSASSRPEIQLFVVGPPDALTRNVDVSALSSWLAVRAIDRETRRLDSIERSEPPPPLPASIPPSTLRRQHGSARCGARRRLVAGAGSASLPAESKGRGAAHLPIEAPVAIAPAGAQPLPPLPAPIELKPPPGAFMLRPRPKPPLALSPPGNP